MASYTQCIGLTKAIVKYFTIQTATKIQLLLQDSFSTLFCWYQAKRHIPCHTMHCSGGQISDRSFRPVYTLACTTLQVEP